MTSNRFKIPPIAPIIVGCRSERAARQLARSLTAEGELIGVTVTGANVRVPWTGGRQFITELFERSVKAGWVAPHIAASALRTRLAELDRRAGA